jgi:hypothetical protein
MSGAQSRRDDTLLTVDFNLRYSAHGGVLAQSRRDDTLLTGGFNRRKSAHGGARGVMARNETIHKYNLPDCFSAFAMTLSLRDCAPLIFCVHLSIFDF